MFSLLFALALTNIVLVNNKAETEKLSVIGFTLRCFFKLEIDNATSVLQELNLPIEYYLAMNANNNGFSLITIN